MDQASVARHERLLGYLAQDPDNLALLSDAATAALEAGDPGAAAALIARYRALEPAPPELLSLEAVAAMHLGRHAEAAVQFEQLLAGAPDDAALGFNLAWAKAMLGQWSSVPGLLTDPVVAAAPQAAALKVQALHHLGALEEALAWGDAAAAQRPGDMALMAALSVVAMDLDEAERAEAYARRAGDTHEGLSTLGLLTLGRHRADEALALFDQALGRNPDSARALLGKGLVLLTQGEAEAAARLLDRGAKMFGDHLGSWVAAGWAYCICGDRATGRARFSTALELDDTFAESHGGLAVLDLLDGDLASARRRTDVALRLDRMSFAGALAKSLLLAQDGQADAAERVRAIAMNTPIGPSGVTIAQAMVGLSVGPKPPV